MKAKIYIDKWSVKRLKEGLIVVCSETDTGIQIEVDADKLFYVRAREQAKLFSEGRVVDTVIYVPDMELFRDPPTFRGSQQDYKFEEANNMVGCGHIDGWEAAREFVDSRKKE